MIFTGMQKRRLVMIILFFGTTLIVLALMATPTKQSKLLKDVPYS